MCNKTQNPDEESYGDNKAGRKDAPPSKRKNIKEVVQEIRARDAEEILDEDGNDIRIETYGGLGWARRGSSSSVEGRVCDSLEESGKENGQEEHDGQNEDEAPRRERKSIKEIVQEIRARDAEEILDEDGNDIRVFTYRGL